MSTKVALPADAALPHLARALDADTMAPAFAELLHGRWRLLGCHVDRVKYRPGRNCTLSYELKLSDAVGTLYTQRVAARLCSGDAARRHARALAQSLRPSPAGPAVHLWPEMDLLTWWWPNDAKLAATRVLADRQTLQRDVLPPLVAVLSGGEGRLTDHRMAVAQYVPEHRVTARFDLTWREGTRTVQRTVYGKASMEPDDGTAHRYLAALQSGAAWQAGALRTPAALLWQPEFGLHWQAAVPGTPWMDLTPAHALSLSGSLGGQLAALHATPVVAERAMTQEMLAQRLHEVLDVLHRALPASRPMLDRAASSLEGGLRTWRALPPVTLHGDLHPGNVLVAEDRLALIDLDGLRRGPAVLELGSWQAEGIYRAVLEGAAPMRDRAQWTALLDGYAAAGGTRPAADALAWATAWNLLTQRAWRCVVNLKPGRLAIAPTLVAMAAELGAASTLETARC
jgi:Phosphotransferase enzyme family